ncbi:MAG TPA: FtsW/RodA/SpoVE family cell cycle protein [Ktedonobacterales bacterium]|nr:FtsW/RodA/SpoVE family cell cycle protein [Ktedonobacterales bacterium]
MFDLRRYGIDRRHYRWTELFLLVLPALFLIIALLTLLVVQSSGGLVSTTKVSLPKLDAFVPAFGLIAALLGAHFALNIIAPDADQTILPIAGTLSSIGVIMALRIGPDLGQPTLGNKQLVFVILGLVCCVGTVKLTQDLRWLRNFKYTWAVVGIVLVGITLAHAHSFSSNAPGRDVLTFGSGGLSFQPSEILKICLVIFFAGYLSENREMLAMASYRIGFLKLPPLKHLGPLVAMLGLALVIFLGIHELGLAILIFGLFLSMLYVASNRPVYIVVALLLFGIGALIAYQHIPYAKSRVDIVHTAFQTGNPDQPATDVSKNAGYQIVQGLVAFGRGGVFGEGLGLGAPCIVPECNSDYVASSFGEEFGFAGLLALLGLFMLLVYRGMHIAVNNRDTFKQLMVIGLTAVFALQTVVILAGNLKIMPLTGIPLPFVAYGGSSLLANFIIIGLLIRLSQSKA